MARTNKVLETRSESPKERDNLRDLAADGRITDNNWTQMVREGVDGDQCTSGCGKMV
jgi:hypothetical protein